MVLKNVCNTIKIIKIETEIDRKDERFRTIFVTFYNKNVFFYMFVGRNQLAFVEWLFWQSGYAFGAVAVIKRD